MSKETKIYSKERNREKNARGNLCQFYDRHVWIPLKGERIADNRLCDCKTVPWRARRDYYLMKEPDYELRKKLIRKEDELRDEQK